MPASSSPICSREPVSTVWRHETNGSQFNWLRVLRQPRIAKSSAGILIPAKQLKQWATSPGKTLWLYVQTPAKPKGSDKNAEAVSSPFHHSARRDLHPGLDVQPERDATRSTRFRLDIRGPAGGRLQQQESIGGLRDLLRQRDQCPLTKFSFLPSTSNDPDGMPPSGSLCVCKAAGAAGSKDEGPAAHPSRLSETSRTRDAATVTPRLGPAKNHRELA
jgi:hypothetical protein